MHIRTIMAAALLSGCFFITACGGGTGHTPPASTEEAFIPVDSANKMLQSYLNSIQYRSNDTDLRSIIIDANALREYLNSPGGQSVSHMKVMLAHTLSYINAGNANIPCGYHSGDLTIILAGYNDQGSYIYNHGNEVMDNGMGCPANCPTAGPAAQDLLPAAGTR